MEVELGSEIQFSTVMDDANHGAVGWMSQSLTYTATASTELLSFIAVGTPNGEPPFALLDGVSVTADAPEPGTSALIGIGLLAIPMARRLLKKRGNRPSHEATPRSARTRCPAAVCVVSPAHDHLRADRKELGATPQKLFRKAFGTDLIYYFLGGLVPKLLLILPMTLIAAGCITLGGRLVRMGCEYAAVDAPHGGDGGGRTGSYWAIAGRMRFPGCGLPRRTSQRGGDRLAGKFPRASGDLVLRGSVLWSQCTR